MGCSLDRRLINRPSKYQKECYQFDMYFFKSQFCVNEVANIRSSSARVLSKAMSYLLAPTSTALFLTGCGGGLPVKFPGG